MADDLWTYDSPLPDAGDWSVPDVSSSEPATRQQKRKRPKFEPRSATPVDVVDLDDLDDDDDESLVLDLPGFPSKQQCPAPDNTGCAGTSASAPAGQASTTQQGSNGLVSASSLDVKTQQLAQADQAILALLKAPADDVGADDDIDLPGTGAAGRYYRSRITNLRPRSRPATAMLSPAPLAGTQLAASSNGADEGIVACGGEKIKVKVRWENGEVALMIGKAERFVKLFERFSEFALQKGIATAGAQPVFTFDGERVQEQQRPEDLDLEGDEILEVKFS